MLATLYLGWSVLAQAHVERMARTWLAAEGIVAAHLLVTPTPFDTVLWRVVAVAGARHHEGFRALLDTGERMRRDAFPRGMALQGALREVEAGRQISCLRQGPLRARAAGIDDHDTTITISDLRMGQEPVDVFTFAVAEVPSAPRALLPPRQTGARPRSGPFLRWLGRRMRRRDPAAAALQRASRGRRRHPPK